MTAGALRRALAALPEKAEVVVYADWQGPGERIFWQVEERLCVCGYFAVVAAEADEEMGVLMLGEEVFAG